MWIIKYKDEIVFTTPNYKTLDDQLKMFKVLNFKAPLTYEWLGTKQPTIDILAQICQYIKELTNERYIIFCSHFRKHFSYSIFSGVWSVYIMVNKKGFFKKRSPYWRTLRKLSNQIVAAKKGRGSYRRKDKHKEKCYD